MKKTKKVTALVLAALLFAASATACASAPVSSVPASSAPVESTELPAKADKTEIRITALKGPTGLGMLKLMDDSQTGTAGGDYKIGLAAAPDQITAALIKGDIDVAAVPTNLAAVLYNKTQGGVQLAVLHTLGVLSLLTKGEKVGSIADLKGKTVYASAKGSTTEYVFNYILEQNGLVVGKDVQVEYKSEHAELAAALLAGDAKIALLPEPFVTQVMSKDPEVALALNITKEWDKVAHGESALAMGSLVVRKDFAEQHKEAFDRFLEEYKESVKYVNTNIEEAAALSEKFDIMPAEVAKKAIPNCNIVYMDGIDMKANVPDFLNVLFKADPKSVGGKLPGEDFYYAK